MTDIVIKYQIPIGESTDPLDVLEFNERARRSLVEVPNEGDIGIFVDNNDPPSSVMPEGRYYIYHNKLWFLNVVSTTILPLDYGRADTFRKNLNSNFNQIGDLGDTIDKNLELLKEKLKPVATTALARDLTDDETHRFTSDAWKTYWNERSIYVAPSNGEGQHKVWYDDGRGEEQAVDITEKLATLIKQNIPTTTKELGAHDNTYILVETDGYRKPESYCWSVTDINLSIRPTTTEEYLQYGWYYIVSYPLENSPSSLIHDYQIPYVFFNQEMLRLGIFSSVCASLNGYVKFGCSLPTLPTNNMKADIVVVLANTFTNNVDPNYGDEENELS